MRPLYAPHPLGFGVEATVRKQDAQIRSIDPSLFARRAKAAFSIWTSPGEAFRLAKCARLV